jgi:hypothetical protein
MLRARARDRESSDSLVWADTHEVVQMPMARISSVIVGRTVPLDIVARSDMRNMGMG